MEKDVDFSNIKPPAPRVPSKDCTPDADIPETLFGGSYSREKCQLSCELRALYHRCKLGTYWQDIDLEEEYIMNGSHGLLHFFLKLHLYQIEGNWCNVQSELEAFQNRRPV